SIASIVTMNNLSDPDNLKEGQTLTIPRLAPVRVTVSPSQASPGAPFTFKLVGAKASEQVTFEVDSPDGSHTGPPHTVADDGTVRATYKTSPTDSAGVYRVTAKGNLGTTAEATFGVTVAGATTVAR